jgi:septum formation protein
LAQLVSEFEVLPADLDEDALTVADPWDTARRLAEAKAAAIFELRPQSLVIGSDTVVALEVENGYQQLSKPIDRQDAIAMLRKLSGKTHLVITGLALVSPGGKQVGNGSTEVSFRELSLAEIESYVDTGEPMDKAGGYAIQGGAASFVEGTRGSISNVIGLPMTLLEEMLEKIPTST